MRRLTLLLAVPMVIAACSDDKSAAPSATVPATVCATSAAPDGRLVHVTLDDVVNGFGSLGSRSNSGLTPGLVRIELEGDAKNAGPAAVQILKDGTEVATIAGVAPGATCGIDLEVDIGKYQILNDAGQDVEFEVTLGE